MIPEAQDQQFICEQTSSSNPVHSVLSRSSVLINNVHIHKQHKELNSMNLGLCLASMKQKHLFKRKMGGGEMATAASVEIWTLFCLPLRNLQQYNIRIFKVEM